MSRLAPAGLVELRHVSAIEIASHHGNAGIKKDPLN